MNKRNPNVRKAKSVFEFKNSIKLEKLGNSLYNVYDTLRVKFLSLFRLQFIDLNEHKFNLGFNDTVNLIGRCRTEVKTNEHFLLCCHCFSSQKS